MAGTVVSVCHASWTSVSPPRTTVFCQEAGGRQGVNVGVGKGLAVVEDVAVAIAPRVGVIVPRRSPSGCNVPLAGTMVLVGVWLGRGKDVSVIVPARVCGGRGGGLELPAY